MTASPPPVPRKRRAPTIGVPLALAGTLLLAALYFLVVHAPQARRDALAVVEQEFNLRADERQTAVTSWLVDRLDDARTIAHFPTVETLVEGRPASPGVDSEGSEHMAAVLVAFLTHRGIRSVFVVDRGGTVVARAAPDGLHASCVEAGMSRDVGSDGRVDVHAHPDGQVALQFVAPVGTSGGRVIAESLAAEWLCPLVGQRALTAGSAQWRLVHAIGDDVAWICSGAEANTAPLTIRRPLDTPGLGSVAALSGQVRFGVFRDYRGEVVFAAPRPLVPGWGLVLKVDQAEVIATIDRQLVRSGLSGAGLLVLLAALALVAWRSRERAHDYSIAHARARQAALLEQANDAIMIVSAQGRVIDANSRAATLFRCERDQLVGQRVIDDLRAPEERAGAGVQFDRVLTEGHLVAETVLQAADGTAIPAEISSARVQDETGPVVVSVVRDIGGRRIAQRRMERLNRVLRTLSEVNQLLLKSGDVDTLLSSACRAIAETGGFVAAWIGRAEADGLVRPVASWGDQFSLLERVVVRWDDSPQGGGPSGQAIRQRRTVVLPDLLGDPSAGPWREALRDKGLRSVAVSPIQVRGEVFGTLSLYSAEPDAFDEETVTLLEKLAADLGFGLQALEDRQRRAASEAQFRTVFDNAALGIVLASMDGRPLRANQAFLDMIGYTEDELRSMRFDRFSHPDDVPREWPLYEEILAGTRDTYRIEKRYTCRGGRELWGSLTLSTVRDEAGQPAYFIGLVEDISERRRLQEQFLQAQKMEGIGRLAGGVAHDFNNLLTAILGYAELLRAELAEGHEAVPFVDEISKAGARAATLTSQLLAFARRQIIEPRVLDLNAVVTEAERLLRRLVGEDVEVVTALSEDLGRVEADPGQLHQVLVNLAVNARDAMPSGGRLVIETANVTVDERFGSTHGDVPPGSYVMLTVSDTGVGLSPDVQAHLFEPFFTTKAQGKGTGLGLATCHGIVTQSHGHIGVYSEPGVGTSFRLYFPRVTTDAAGEAGTLGGTVALRGGTETVLVAEDEPAVRQLAALSLRSYGYHVLEAADGDEALRLADAHPGPLQLLVTDVVMPRMTGSELARRFAAMHPDVRVLFMSGHAERTIAHQGVLEPGVEFLPKPFTPERLARRVREVLDA